MFNNRYVTTLGQSNVKDILAKTEERLVIDAIYSDETENFVAPCEPTDKEPVKVSLRTTINNVDEVYINFGQDKKKLKKQKDEGIFSFYSYTFSAIPSTISYYFSVIKNSKVYYYNKRGIFEDLDTHYNFKIIPNFKVPDWVKGAVMYQIYIDRFSNGDKSNDVITNEYSYLNRISKQVSDWYEPVAVDDVCNFYGGDLQGVIDKFSYLKDLGVEVIYFNPAFVSPSNHKYDAQDYDYIDPHHGVIINDGGRVMSSYITDVKKASMYIKRTTNIENLEASNQLMARLINTAHSFGIKVILDGVFNHCGAFHKWLNKEGIYNAEKGAYEDKNSPYAKYFKWYDDNWPNNTSYDSWWGHLNHPKLNFEESEELYNYMMDIGKKWVSEPFNADGWRLDVAADLGFTEEFNHKFWKDFRKSVKEANPNAVILAEHYGDPSAWLQGDEWDTIMNYDAFMEPITWFLTGMEKHSEEFKGDMLCNSGNFESAMRYNMSKLSIQSTLSSMNQLSNHDHSRFLTRTNMKAGRLHTVGAQAANEGINKGIMFEAIVFQMTWIGAPTIYYGDEAGLTGWTDPDNRRTYPWGREDRDMLNFHREMVKVHKKYSSIKTGSLEYLHNEYGVISYGRWNSDNKVAVILNNNNESRELNIPVWKLQVGLNTSMETVVFTRNNGYTLVKTSYDVVDGFMKIILPAYSSVVLTEV